MLQIRQLPLGTLQTNCYLLGCEETQQAAVIDPAWNGRAIAAAAEDDGWQITHILLTHSHFDHVGGLQELKELTGAPIYIHPEAIETLNFASMSAAFFGLRIPSPPPPDEMLVDGQVLAVGKLQIHVLYTPGHAPGHVSFHLPEYRVAFDGDVLFREGIGRTDFPGGDHETLMQTIWSKLMSLPDETRIFSGHGQPTTVGEERLRNPFLQG
ncbi:MAG: MBL fold metallo-hydrolase [Chloroflexota bacterium]